MVWGRGVVAFVACGAIVACGGREAAAPVAASGAASPAGAEAPVAAEPGEGVAAGLAAAAERPASNAAPAVAPAAPAAPASEPSEPAAEGWTVDESLDVTWSFAGEVTRRMDGDALVVSGAGLPEVRVVRRATPAEIGDSAAPATGLGDRYFGPVWISCTTGATGEAAAPAEAFCASLRPVEHAKAEVLECEAPAPHPELLKAFIAELGPELLNCLRDARAFYPTLAGVESSIQVRFSGDGIPFRLGHGTDIGQTNASDSYGDCVYRIVKDLKYPNANGSEVDARCKLRLSLYGQPAPAGR